MRSVTAPQPPYSVRNRINGRCLEFGDDGTCESCQTLIRELKQIFGAPAAEHLEAGPRPFDDKEKGYWIIHIEGEEFFLMRERGCGTCLWGPRPPADPSLFLRVAGHFGAREYVSWPGRTARWLHLTGSST